jgi:hypothetical protein
MAFTFTDLLHLAMPARGDKNWDADINRALRTIDNALGDLGARPRYFDKRVVTPGAVSVTGRDVSVTGIEAVVGQTKTTLDGGAATVPANTTWKPRMDSLSIDPAAPGTLVLTQGDPAEILDTFRVGKVFDKNNTNLGDLMLESGVAPIIGLLEDPVNDRLVALIMRMNRFDQSPEPPILCEFDPETGQFTNLNVTFRVSSAFQQDVGPLNFVLPIGCIAPNAAGTDVSYFFLSLLGIGDSPMSVSLCEFDSTGLLVRMYGLANADGNYFPALPFNMRYTGRGTSDERLFEAHLWPLSVKLAVAKPFMADLKIPSPAANVKMLGQDIIFGSVSAKAIEMDLDSIQCLDPRGDRLLMPGGGLSESGVLVGGTFDWNGQIHSLIKGNNRNSAPWNSVQGEIDNRDGFNPLLLFPEVLKNTYLWDMNAAPVAPSFASPVTPANTPQLAMFGPVNDGRIHFNNVQTDSARMIINSGYKQPPVGKSIVVHIKTRDGIDCWWENAVEDFGGGEIGILLDSTGVFRGSSPSDYNQLNWNTDGREIRIGVRTNNGNNYEERAFTLTGVHDNDIGKPVRCVYDDGSQRFEFISYICAAGEKRKIYADTDNLGDDWLGPIYREANRGDIHIGWNVLDSDNAESWPKSAILTPLVRQQDTDFITLAQWNNYPSPTREVTYSNGGETGTWLDPNAGTNGDTYRLDDSTLVSSSGLPQKSGGGTDYGALDPNSFSCDLGHDEPMLTVDVLTDPSSLTVELIPYTPPLVEKARLDIPSIIGVSAGVTRHGGGHFAFGLTFAGFPAGVIMEFSPFAKPVAPDVPANHIKVGEVLVLPDEESPDILPENVLVEPDYSDATVSRADQVMSFLIASYLNSDFRNITNIAMNFLPILANMK